MFDQTVSLDSSRDASGVAAGSVAQILQGFFRAVHGSNTLATIYHAIGIEPATSFVNSSGRPTAILDQREPIRELL